MKLSSRLRTALSSATIVALAAIPSAEVAGQAADPPKAKSTLILEQELEGLPGYVVQVVLIEGPPGWWVGVIITQATWSDISSKGATSSILRT